MVLWSMISGNKYQRESVCRSRNRDLSVCAPLSHCQQHARHILLFVLLHARYKKYGAASAGKISWNLNQNHHNKAIFKIQLHHDSISKLLKFYIVNLISAHLWKLEIYYVLKIYCGALRAFQQIFNCVCCLWIEVKSEKKISCIADLAAKLENVFISLTHCIVLIQGSVCKKRWSTKVNPVIYYTGPRVPADADHLNDDKRKTRPYLAG